MVPESVDIIVPGKKQKGFRVRHRLEVMGFDREKNVTKEDVVIRVKSLLNLIKETGIPSKDFSA
jgi:hypothetical protein